MTRSVMRDNSVAVPPHDPATCDCYGLFGCGESTEQWKARIARSIIAPHILTPEEAAATWPHRSIEPQP
jgi:hypothetical protein